MKKNSHKLLLITLLWVIFGCDKSSDWTGVFESKNEDMYGKLAMKNEGDSIKFQLYSTVDGNMGYFEGAFYPKFDSGKFQKENCSLTFNILNDSTIVLKDQIGYCYAGLAVYYEGVYSRTNENYVEIEF